MGVQELFESYDKRKRKSHFKNLLAVAMADGKLENIEFDYIMQLASKCYISEEEIKRVIEHPEAISFVPPKTDREKFDQLYDLVTVMLVDGEIDNRELTLCKTFAMRLGFRTQIIDDMIRNIITNVVKGIAAEIAINEFSNMLDE
jgi:uncharacterized tellurite resistance protein B-like protein